MAASAPHEADAPPPSPPRHIAPIAWGALAVALIATAAWLGTRNVDGRMGAELPPAKTVAAKPPPWSLAVDGIVVGSKPAVVQQREKAFKTRKSESSRFTRRYVMAVARKR